MGNTQESLALDTMEVRTQFAMLIGIVEAINLSSLTMLPLLPRQKKEARALMMSGETSKFWAIFALCSGLTFLIYSTCVIFLTVAAQDTVGCYKILGGAGCTEDESSIPTYILMGIVFLFCYGVNFYFTFLPVIQGKRAWTWSQFF